MRWESKLSQVSWATRWTDVPFTQRKEWKKRLVKGLLRAQFGVCEFRMSEAQSNRDMKQVLEYPSWKCSGERSGLKIYIRELSDGMEQRENEGEVQRTEVWVGWKEGPGLCLRSFSRLRVGWGDGSWQVSEDRSGRAVSTADWSSEGRLCWEWLTTGSHAGVVAWCAPERWCFRLNTDGPDAEWERLKDQHVRMCRMLSWVWLSATSRTAARQAPLSMGFPRQEYWRGLPFPPPRDLLDPGSNLRLLYCRWSLYPLSHL